MSRYCIAFRERDRQTDGQRHRVGAHWPGRMQRGTLVTSK